MTKNAFKGLFIKNVDAAVLKAESILFKKIPHDLDIELHGGGQSGKIISVDEAVDIMFIGENSFYQIIDVGVIETRDNNFRLFVRVSAHKPSTFENTWNSPIGNGPFKVIEPLPKIGNQTSYGGL